MSQTTTSGIVNIKLQAWLDLFSGTATKPGRRIRAIVQLFSNNQNGTLFEVTDWLWNNTYYLVTDLKPGTVITDSTGANKASVDASGRLTVIAFLSANPTVLQGGVGVGQVAWKTVVSSGFNPIFGQTTTTLGVATQLSTNTNIFATLLIRNQDTVNSFALGDSTVTFATGVRFPGVANEIPVPLNVGINANKFYVIDNGVSTVVVEWMFL